MILVTGAAGFIGFHLTRELLTQGKNVLGIDNLNNYYDPDLKHARLRKLAEHPNSILFKFLKADIADKKFMRDVFESHNFEGVVNLAAQAGVRYSIENPYSYLDSNINGFLNVLEGCRRAKVEHLVYASSSSVYGMNVKQPFSTTDTTDFPISLYAATKKSNELMAHAYSHLYCIPTTGLRFFTVYGPYGRPDMAYYKFTKSVLNKEPIDVYNGGNMRRDFTYIDDIVEGIVLAMKKIPEPNLNEYSRSNPPYKIYNIGNNNPVSLDQFICCIERACGLKARRNLLEMQAGDVPITFADVDDIKKDLKYKPLTSISVGIDKFVNWYKEFYF